MKALKGWMRHTARLRRAEKSSVYFFGPVMRGFVDDCNLYKHAGPWQKPLAMRMLGKRVVTVCGSDFYVDQTAWAILVAGCDMEELALQLTLLRAERDVLCALLKGLA